MQVAMLLVNKTRPAYLHVSMRENAQIVRVTISQQDF
jgi:hypothetical protein